MKIHNIFLLSSVLALLLVASCGTISFTTSRVSHKVFPPSDQESKVKYPCVIDLEESEGGTDMMICPQPDGDFDRLYAIDAYIVNDLSTKEGHLISRLPEFDIE